MDVRTQKRFTVADVARLCRLHPATIIQSLRSEKLKGHKLPGKRDDLWNIERDNLIAFMKEWNIPLGELEEAPSAS